MSKDIKQFIDKNNDMNENFTTDTIVLGAGCFWCVEAIFQNVNGVLEVIPGYCNGSTKHPTYKEVCSGESGHAEVARIVYDSQKIKLSSLLEVFWKTHDPTTLNRQGNDIGSQYRSGIFCLNNAQLEQAQDYKDQLDFEKIWSNPIVTQIELLDEFYEAENYHHNYYNNNRNQGYCKYIIEPKIDKYYKVFGTLGSEK
jgi:peptide-methionine (S)-S-oxide reductase